MRMVLAAFGLILASPAFAQGGPLNTGTAIVPDRPPNVRPADAKNTDGRAVASPEVLAVISAAVSSPRRVLLGGDAVRIRDLVLADGKLDDAEFDLIDELSAHEIRAIRVSPASGRAEPFFTGTVSGDTLRVFEAMFEARYRANWDAKDPVKGWRELLREAMLSNGSHTRIRAFLGSITKPAAEGSTAANTYGPLRSFISAYSLRNEKLPLPERTLGRRLAYEAMVDTDNMYRGSVPDFIYSWLKNPPKEP